MSAKEEADRMKAALSYITLRMWGGDAPTHPDIEAAFDKVLNRAYSTDRAWEHIGKMCESAARKAGDAEARLAALRARLTLLKICVVFDIGDVAHVVDATTCAWYYGKHGLVMALPGEHVSLPGAVIASPHDDRYARCLAGNDTLFVLSLARKVERLEELYA